MMRRDVLNSGIAELQRERAERSAVNFVTLQFFCLIYLQKFAVGPHSFEISVPMLIMFASMCWMVALGRLALSPARLGLYLAFAACCLLSQALAGARFSESSMLEVFLLYSFMTVTTNLSVARYEQLLRTFVKIMIFPACVVLFQFVFQKVTGLSNPLNMNRLVPPQFLLQGYVYEAPYQWGHPFMRPNGFFFLETSFASAFTASAAIIEMTYFKRPAMMMLMVAATILSLGGTGITMLLVALPFLLARQSPRIVGIVLVAAAVVAVVVYAFDIPLPLMSRVGELDRAGSSGAGRLLLPALEVARHLTNPNFFFTGTGAGSVTFDDGSLWPAGKLLFEYGLVTMLAFIALYSVGVAGKFNVPLKIALTVTYHVTGGYLLSPIMVELVALLCFVATPVRPAPRRLASPLGRWPAVPVARSDLLAETERG